MKKNIIIGLVLIIVISLIYFLTQNKAPVGEPPIALENNLNTTEESSGVLKLGEESIITETVPITNNVENKKIMNAILHTNKGNITVEFFAKDAPKTVANFLKLAGDGFYSGIKFHRVIKGFMIQGGDPLSKDDSKMADWGTGGPGYTLPAEIKMKNTRGTIATARLGDQVNPKKESSGSQFFINTVDNAFLDDNYTVFGQVVSGMDVVDAIANVKTVQPGLNDRPIDPVIINSISLQ